MSVASLEVERSTIARVGILALRAFPLAAAALLLFSRLDCCLLEPEESRYAEIPRQMLVEARFVTPVWHGETYWQKPPLFYWLVMASYQLFGVHDWAARLVPCLAAFATIAVVYAWAWRTAGATAGLCSALVLTLSARFLYQGRMLTLDSLLGLWVVVGLTAGHIALEERQKHDGARRCLWRWWLLSAAAVGLGVLTKGPVALVLVAGPLGLWTLFSRQAARLRLGHWAAYVLIVLLIAAPWYVALAITDRDAAGAFFWLHNLQRYVAPFDHAEPFWFFVPIVLLGTLPWSLLAVPLTASLIRRGRAGMGTAPGAFFLLAFVWGFVFFSASGCKRACYIVPVLPLWAAALGTFLAQALRGDAQSLNPRLWLSPALFAGTTLVLGIGVSLTASVSGLWSWPLGLLAAACLVAGGLLLPVLRRLPFRHGWGLCVAIAFLVLLIGVLEMLPAYHRRFGLRGQVRRHVEVVDEIPVACYPRRWDSVSFYLERDVRLYTPSERPLMMHDLLRSERTLMFVKSRGFLEEFLTALPELLQFVPCERQGANVTSGFVVRRR